MLSKKRFDQKKEHSKFDPKKTKQIDQNKRTYLRTWSWLTKKKRTWSWIWPKKKHEVEQKKGKRTYFFFDKEKEHT